MAKNNINIYKANNHLLHQLTERKKDHELRRGKSMSWIGKSTKT
jgi:hypothetical protein